MLRKSIVGLILITVLAWAYGAVGAQEPGEDSIGDPFFPSLGNGGYDVQHYTLDLTVDVADNFIDGLVTIEALATQDLSAFNLDFVGFEISEITVNDSAATFEREPHELIITPADVLRAEQPFTVRVAYRGTPTNMNAAPSIPFLSGWANYGEGVFVANEPAGAAGWFPVNDHPLDKATYTLRITVPEPYMVAANGVLTDTIEQGDRATYVWEANDALASYVVALNIGEFTMVTEEGPDGLPIRHFFPPEIAEIGQMNFRRTSDMIAFFNDLFGPYPFEAYGVVVAKTQLGFALENQTLSLFGLDHVAAVGSVDEVAAHELAHQWLGNHVSLSTWQDIWLNEGFATYASWLWFEHDTNRSILDRRVTDAYNTIAEDTRKFTLNIGRDQVVGLVEAMPLNDMQLPAHDAARITELLLTGAAEDEVTAQIALLPSGTVSGAQLIVYLSELPFDSVKLASADVDELFTLLGLYDVLGETLSIPASRFLPPGRPTQRDLFNRGMYWRGALTLHALRLQVGDESFFEILKTYYDRHQGGNVTTADFIAVAEDISGQALDEFFNAWLYDPIIPAIPEMDLSME